MENPSSVAPSDWRPRPLCICAWTAALRGCGAAGHSAAGTHTHPRPPGAVPYHPVHPQLRCKPLRAALGRAPCHGASSRGHAKRRTGVLQTRCPDSPLLPQVLTLACAHPEADDLPSSLRVPSARVRPAGAAPWPRLELRSTGGSRPGAAPGAGRATAAGQPGKRSSGCARWQHRDRTPAPASGGSPDDALASQGPPVESRAMCASALLGR